MEKAINDQKEAGLFQKFIFWFLIPLLFLLFVALLVTSIAGVNVFEKVKELSENNPLATYLEEKKEETNLVSEYEGTISTLEVEIEEKSLELDGLKSELATKTDENDRLLIEQARLEATIEELRQRQIENKRAFKDIISTYESMAPKNAAPILLEMKELEAVSILANLSVEPLAKILEKMPAERAAKYLELLAAETE